MLLLTRSRRCINSPTLSFSSNAGAGGVNLMFDGGAVTLIATPAGLSIATTAQTANSAKITRAPFNFFI
jgi:hypothetical protein